MLGKINDTVYKESLSEKPKFSDDNDSPPEKKGKLLIDVTCDKKAFSVATGLRPSEQVALKWSAIDDQFFSVELSRIVGFKEKDDLKTESSVRTLTLRPALKKMEKN